MSVLTKRFILKSVHTTYKGIKTDGSGSGVGFNPFRRCNTPNPFPSRAEHNVFSSFMVCKFVYRLRSNKHKLSTEEVIDTWNPFKDFERRKQTFYYYHGWSIVTTPCFIFVFHKSSRELYTHDISQCNYDKKGFEIP